MRPCRSTSEAPKNQCTPGMSFEKAVFTRVAYGDTGDGLEQWQRHHSGLNGLNRLNVPAIQHIPPRMTSQLQGPMHSTNENRIMIECMHNSRTPPAVSRTEMWPPYELDTTTPAKGGGSRAEYKRPHRGRCIARVINAVSMRCQCGLLVAGPRRLCHNLCRAAPP